MSFMLKDAGASSARICSNSLRFSSHLTPDRTVGPFVITASILILPALSEYASSAALRLL